MAIAPQRSDRHPPALHHRGRPPLRRGALGAAVISHHDYRDGTVAFEQLGVECRVLERQRHKHPRPKVLPRDPRHP